MKKKLHSGKSRATVRAFHDRFVKAFIATGENATQAYLKVKPHVAINTAGAEGHKLLKIPEIQRAIEKHRVDLRARFALTTDRVIQELARVAYFNPRRVVGEDGKAKKLHELDDDAAAAMQVELDGDGKVLKMRTPAPAAKNTAVKQAVKILRLEDRPPPPPPDPVDAEQFDKRDLARRMAFMLAEEAHTSEREGKPQPKAVRKKVSLPA